MRWPFGGTEAFASVLRLIALLALTAGQCGCWEGTNREALATVLSIEGPVEISSDGGRTIAKLRPDQNPGKNETLHTPSAARLSLAVLPNCLVQAEPETTIEIGRIALTKDGNETGNNMRGRFADLKLASGRLTISHAWGEAVARFTVNTAHGELIVTSNALFRVEADANRTRVTCAGGSLGFRPKQATSTTRVSSGFTAESDGGPVNLAPAEIDAVAQESVVEALQVEQKLRELAARARNLLPR